MVGAAVGVGLSDEEHFPHTGKLDFIENRLDADTGTLRARAIVPNTEGLFSSGMFARVRLQGSPEYQALLLPDEAIDTDQATRFVYVVGSDDVPERRTVELGPLVDCLRVVRKGIAPNDWTSAPTSDRTLSSVSLITVEVGRMPCFNASVRAAVTIGSNPFFFRSTRPSLSVSSRPNIPSGGCQSLANLASAAINVGEASARA